MKRLLPLILVLTATTLFAQQSDFLVLKKGRKTITRYYSGMQIDFTTNTGAYITSYIQRIQNDTLYLKEYIVKTIPTQLGVYILDTVATYYHHYHYHQIKNIGSPNNKFNVSGSAATLMGGGALLVLASGVVFLVDREKFSPGLLIGSAALGGIGYLLAKTSGRGMEIGKKYHFEYLNLSDNKKQ